jgi:hypothetical protein
VVSFSLASLPSPQPPHSLSEGYRPHLEGRTLAISFMTVGELYEGRPSSTPALLALASLTPALVDFRHESFGVPVVVPQVRSGTDHAVEPLRSLDTESDLEELREIAAARRAGRPRKTPKAKS